MIVPKLDASIASSMMRQRRIKLFDFLNPSCVLLCRQGENDVFVEILWVTLGVEDEVTSDGDMFEDNVGA